MKAVVLDGYTLNPGDISWEALKHHADLTIYDKTEPDCVYDRVKNCAAIFTNKVPITRELIARLPELKYIGILATGFNVIDIQAAHEAGITVTNTPAYATDSVAQLIFAFIFQFYWHVKEHSDKVHTGTWSASSHFCYTSYPLFELSGKTLGIIGFGAIGQKTAEIAEAMSMNVIYMNRSKKSTPHLKARQVDMLDLLRSSDIISLSAPLNEESKQIINKSALAEMKSSTLIINTGRGQLIDDTAMAEALRTNKIGGYAADVLSVEPPPRNHPLFGCPNCIITPHIAWQSVEARTRLMHCAAENFRHFLDGKPVHVI